MNDNKKSTDLGTDNGTMFDAPGIQPLTDDQKEAIKLEQEEYERISNNIPNEDTVWLIERLQAENEMLRSKLDWALSLLENREVNIKNLTSLLDAIPPRHTDEELENLAYLRDNFIDQRMDYYSHFHMSEEDARESAEEDALEHFPASLAVTQ